jgi:hypothetical protein
MRGHPRHNFPVFDRVARELRELGHVVCNPADHDREIGFSEETEEVSSDLLHGMMRWDFEQIMASDAVVFLPGWPYSKGAKAERVVAHYVGVPCYDYDPQLPERVRPQWRYHEPTVLWRTL